jgi:prepilin-type N-terminal cleavage/methylation domain-containing protein/prepilin-type processing-associated H-X9-DG protein
MSAPGRRGFTLIEVLVVVALIGILLALLMGGASGIYEMMQLTQCQWNLKAMYEAHVAWRSDHNQSRFVTGAGWVDAILPYLEEQESVTKCPKGPNIYFKETYGLRLGDIAWEIYSGGQYKYDIPLDSDFIFKTKVGPNRIKYEIEDQRTGGDYASDHRDIVVEVSFTEDGRPYEIYFSPEHSGHGYSFKFKILGEIIFDPAPENGETHPLGEYGFATSDYGMSVGSYQAGARVVAKNDGKLFFIMDYAKSLADYNEDSDDDDPEYYFAQGPEGWQPTSEHQGMTWEQVSALRHYAQANVLFCDGHIEALPFEPDSGDARRAGKYLRPDTDHPLWRYQGY